MLRARIRLDLARGLPAVDAGKAEVHHDHIGHVLLYLLESAVAVGRLEDAEPVEQQALGIHQAGVLDVVDYEDHGARHRVPGLCLRHGASAPAGSITAVGGAGHATSTSSLTPRSSAQQYSDAGWVAPWTTALPPARHGSRGAGSGSRSAWPWRPSSWASSVTSNTS